mgnify:CR=1 FL=1
MTANKRRFSWGAVLLVLLAMCLVYYLASGLRSQDAVSYAQVRQLFLDEKVQEFAILTSLFGMGRGGRQAVRRQHRQLRPV